MALAEIYPLVVTRALARPFTYEVGEGVEVGAILQVRLGRATTRGVVVRVGVEAPPGIVPVAAGKLLDTIPATLVELALWLADRYGSTPARAFELVAPRRREAHGSRELPAVRESLEGEAEPERLTDEQREAVEQVGAALARGGGSHFLLHGPTGSGKTEVYLQACSAALAHGRTVIVLVPEIALAPQTVGRFRARFGDTVALIHSSLTEAERRDERDRIVRGEARVVVGARSAVFAPLRNVGLIIVDEEHDGSYKQDSDPRYDARAVAAKRAALEGAVALFGSATPRPESWRGLARVALSSRIGAALPGVGVIDLRDEAGYPLSAPLLAALGRVVETRSRAILLLNRRGVAGALHCRACGTSRTCAACDVALTLHEDGRLHCHHCGFSEGLPPVCPVCGSVELARVGAGTQRLELELARTIPELVTIRLDADVTSRPGSAHDALARFRREQAVALVGTQMVAKGHHVPGVTLAAVVDADTGLSLPDFRAEERTFQLVTQLAGRSGRDGRGSVLVQTFHPDARPLLHAARHDVTGFLTGELERREALGYPPFRRLVTVVVTGPEPEAPLRALREVRARIDGGVHTVLGPAPLLRRRGRHRAQLLVKTGHPQALVRELGALLQAATPHLRRDGLTAVIDVDPQSL